MSEIKKVANSTMEAELIALASASEEANWLRDLLLQIPYFEKLIPPILIHCDSTAAIGRVQNRYYNGKSRPIRRKHSNVRSYLTMVPLMLIMSNLVIILQILLRRT